MIHTNQRIGEQSTKGNTQYELKLTINTSTSQHLEDKENEENEPTFINQSTRRMRGEVLDPFSCEKTYIYRVPR